MLPLVLGTEEHRAHVHISVVGIGHVKRNKRSKELEPRSGFTGFAITSG